ncbi:MAG: DUF1818 family protein [Cyanobacteriota bacterium]|jgi:hypothetical protein
MAQVWRREGEGWRLAWNSLVPQYPGLVGGAGWAVELTEEEAQTLARLLAEIRQTFQDLAEHVMAEERLCCELEGEGIWLEAEGSITSYDLRFILTTGRGFEGYWPGAALAELEAALAVCPGF